jgi:hypothetical protein
MDLIAEHVGRVSSFRELGESSSFMWVPPLSYGDYMRGNVMEYHASDSMLSDS